MAVLLFQQLYRWHSFVLEHHMHNIEGFYAMSLQCSGGSFSRNCTFTVRNYMTGAFLYYYHICQKGKDTCKEDLYEGTLKSVKEFGAEHVFILMAQHGIIVECHVQDCDSTAGNAMLKSFPNC
uniref:Uncharacterized protein n=1 Tax=Amphimedon queenslandica TaxID=400682 RepID=A0A1X7UW32_AMPQE